MFFEKHAKRLKDLRLYSIMNQFLIRRINAITFRGIQDKNLIQDYCPDPGPIYQPLLWEDLLANQACDILVSHSR